MKGKSKKTAPKDFEPKKQNPQDLEEQKGQKGQKEHKTEKSEAQKVGASPEYPAWLKGERFRRLAMACQHFSLLRRTAHARKDLLLEYRRAMAKAGKKPGSYEEVRVMLDEKIPVPKSMPLNKLKDRRGKKALWSQRDIALIMGKEQSSISRNLQRMKGDREWAPRLLAAIPKGEKDGLYNSNVFPLLIEFWEGEYLSRVSKPRRGSRLDWTQEEELRAIWKEMRDVYEEERQAEKGKKRRKGDDTSKT